ncbi:unnamed protein product [Penicillium salamii]|uniref:C2H2-type domain-containing protein n=1 Tax=Penicillium salamii TaxID=1612424 RepID=A0A9W4N6Y5_9EURO|nr:unnamed protein product [Penicillium salamii]CAG8038733.1 unnamed protein product [Penicillium salamii]CAG8054293.1 unnamed protein product [Penicillium salamii]CAG8068184.1 unnamed protein product [Penicillium salamii]CAG8208147.1 unnamed protein product [Penicillium salamii]
MSRPLNPNQRHAHSISLGASNSNHRVTRRKSVTTTAAHAAAAVAASMEGGESTSLPMGAHRRSLGGRKGLESASVGSASGFSSYLSRSINSPSQESPARKGSPGSDHSDGKLKNRNRRASEGAQLKADGKRAAAAIRCDRCGKGYKHGSCLSKHMWEHDPAWAVTSKLLISKHQQVQLLEAASVLVTMNHDDPPDESAELAELAELESELSSGSPDARSELRDGLSSAETTPPPMDEEEDDDFEMSGMPAQWAKRPSVSNASGFSRSYQSIPSSSYNDSAPLHSPTFSHFRNSSIDTRPSTADARLHEDDEADLAAAIGLCNFGTPRTGPVSLTPDVPPVPPLPARYLDSSSHPDSQSPHSAQSRPTMEAARRDSEANIFLSRSFNPSLSYKVSDEREVRTGGKEAQQSRQRRNADVDFGNRSAPADDDDDGVFGRMEE